MPPQHSRIEGSLSGGRHHVHTGPVFIPGNPKASVLIVILLYNTINRFGAPKQLKFIEES